MRCTPTPGCISASSTQTLRCSTRPQRPTPVGPEAPQRTPGITWAAHSPRHRRWWRRTRRPILNASPKVLTPRRGGTLPRIPVLRRRQRELASFWVGTPSLIRSLDWTCSGSEPTTRCTTRSCGRAVAGPSEWGRLGGTFISSPTAVTASARSASTFSGWAWIVRSIKDLGRPDLDGRLGTDRERLHQRCQRGVLRGGRPGVLRGDRVDFAPLGRHPQIAWQPRTDDPADDHARPETTGG